MGYFVVFILILFCLFYTGVLNNFFKLVVTKTKYPTIEGLRGYLAYFVFIHHLSIWYFYSHSGKWEEPPINFFNHLGKSGVAFFFMITGFLFFNKLTDGKSISWIFFLKRRFLRLFPLYAFSIFLLITIVLLLSKLHLNISFGRFFDQFLHWLAFTYVGAPDINDIKDTFIINAGVVWSLRYEILFYVSLPFIGLLFGKRINLVTSLLCAVLIILFFWKTDKVYTIIFLNFLYGMLISFIQNKKIVTKLNLQRGIYTFIFFIMLILNVLLFNTSENFWSITLQAFVFLGIIKGNNLWGILSNKYSQILGQLSYSIYLLHGIVIFFFNTFLFKKSFLMKLDFEEFLLLGVLYTFVILLISFFSHKYIELPYMYRKQKDI